MFGKTVQVDKSGNRAPAKQGNTISVNKWSLNKQVLLLKEEQGIMLYICCLFHNKRYLTSCILPTRRSALVYQAKHLKQDWPTVLTVTRVLNLKREVGIDIKDKETSS